MSIEPHDDDLSKGIRFDVEVHCSRAEPFVQSPLFGRMQMNRKISSILLDAMFFRLIQRVIVACLPMETDAGDGRGRQKIRPGSNAPLPPPSFGSPAHAG